MNESQNKKTTKCKNIMYYLDYIVQRFGWMAGFFAVIGQFLPKTFLNSSIQTLLLASLYHTSAVTQKHIQIALKQLYLVGSEGEKTLQGQSRDIEALSFKGKLCLVSPYSSWCKIIPVVPIGVLHLSWWCKESLAVLPGKGPVWQPSYN